MGMRLVKLVAFVLQLAIAILVTAGGLYFDYKSLAVFGVALFALAIVLGLWAVVGGKSSRSDVRAVQAPANERGLPPSELDDKERALWALRRALTHAKDALPRFSGINRTAALNRLRASYGTVARHYDLPTATISAISVRSLLKGFVGYLDSFVPLLEEGQVQAARNAAKTYIAWLGD